MLVLSWKGEGVDLPSVRYMRLVFFSLFHYHTGLRYTLGALARSRTAPTDDTARW